LKKEAFKEFELSERDSEFSNNAEPININSALFGRNSNTFSKMHSLKKYFTV